MTQPSHSNFLRGSVICSCCHLSFSMLLWSTVWVTKGPSVWLLFLPQPGFGSPDPKRQDHQIPERRSSVLAAE